MTAAGAEAVDAAASASRLVTDLVDDAGLFPPEQLPMAAAVARHRADESAGHPVLTQRFLCPASRLDELRRQLRPDERWRIGLIVDVDLGQLGRVLATVDGDQRLTLETVELRLPTGDPTLAVGRVLDAIGARRGTAVCVELSPANADWAEALSAVAAAGLSAKVRCGGTEATQFPTPGQLATFLLAVTSAGISFKATAGLHHALRHRDPDTGFDHHGFVNLLLATGRAVDGSSRADVEGALLIDAGEELAAQVRGLSSDTAERTRRLFLAYGSCNTAEPVQDLATLGLIGPAPTTESLIGYGGER